MPFFLITIFTLNWPETKEAKELSNETTKFVPLFAMNPEPKVSFENRKTLLIDTLLFTFQCFSGHDDCTPLAKFFKQSKFDARNSRGEWLIGFLFNWDPKGLEVEEMRCVALYKERRRGIIVEKLVHAGQVEGDKTKTNSFWWEGLQYKCGHYSWSVSALEFMPQLN